MTFSEYFMQPLHLLIICLPNPQCFPALFLLMRELIGGTSRELAIWSEVCLFRFLLLYLQPFIALRKTYQYQTISVFFQDAAFDEGANNWDVSRVKNMKQCMMSRIFLQLYLQAQPVSFRKYTTAIISLPLLYQQCSQAPCLLTRASINGTCQTPMI